MAKRWTLYLVLLRNGILEYVRDPVTNMFSFAMPLLFFAIFAITGVITGMSGPSTEARAWTIGIVDDAGTPRSRRLQASLELLDGVAVQQVHREEAQRLFASSKVQAIISIPSGWSGRADEQVIVLTKPYARYVVANALLFAQVNLQPVQQSVTLDPRMASIKEAEAEPNQYFNYLMAGLIGFSLLQLGLYGTATPILASKREGLFRQYSLTPIPLGILAAAHVSVRALMAVLQIAMMVGASMLLVGLRPRSDIGTFLAVAASSAAALISLGYLIGGAFKRVQTGMFVVLGLNFYMMLFGQLFADFRNFPILKFVILGTPLTYVTDAFRHVFLGPTGQIFPVWVDIAALLMWALVLFIVGLRTFTFQARPQ